MSRPTKHGNGWRIRWLDENGRRRSSTFSKRSDAEKALRERKREVELILAGIAPRVAPDKTFNELADYWMDNKASRKRSPRGDQSILKKHLRPAFGHLRLVELKLERVEAFKSRFQRSDKTLHNVLTLLIAMLNYAVELEWLAKAPRIKKPKITIADQDYSYLKNAGEIERFLRSAFSQDHGLGVLYATAIYTGMRAGELAALRWNDIDFGGRLIRIARSYDGPTKGGYERRAPILDPLLPLLRGWKLKNPSELVFPNARGRMHQPSARVFQECLHRVLKDAGFPRKHIRFHDLRHTFASYWMMSGGDLYKLQKIAGWKSHAMVQRYAHLAPDAYRSDWGRFGDAMDLESTRAKVISLSGTH